MTPVSYLLDTNILSEMGRARPDPLVIAFFENADRMSLSVMVLHELQYGFEILKDPDRRMRLAEFMVLVRRRFAASALPIDADVVDLAARMRASAKKAGRALTIADALIAATSAAHDMTLVTRNTKDFADLGIAIVNPFRSA